MFRGNSDLDTNKFCYFDAYCDSSLTYVETSILFFAEMQRCTKFHYRKASGAMGQIPRSIERISSYCKYSTL